MIAVLVVAILVTAATTAVAASLVVSLVRARSLKPIPVPVRNRRTVQR